MKLLTVTVPAYNVDQYLEKCLSSFVCAYDRGQVEILVVNDGSTDQTKKVAQGFAEKYPDMFRVISKQNGGHGSAVNTGIKNAAGRYFKVVDGDDWVDSSSFIQYLDLLATTDADLITNDFCCVNSETMRISQRRTPVLNGGHLFGQHQFDSVGDSLLVRMHSITYRTAILQENDIRLDEHSYYVDMEYNSFPIPYIQNVYISNLPVYMYRLGLGGQSVSMASQRRNINSHENILNRLISFISEQENADTSQQKLCYLRRMAAEMVSAQIKIFLSYPLKSGMMSKAMAFDSELKIKSPGVYDAVDNRAVLLLRNSKYRLFPVASAAVRLTSK